MRKAVRFPFAGRMAAGVLAIMAAGAFAFPAFGEGQGEKAVAYENLSQLLIEGNQGLKQANDNYDTNKKNYQDLMDALREEQQYMKFMAEKYEGTEEEPVYLANAEHLGSQATRLSKQLEAMGRKTQTLSVEKNVDAYTMAAQAIMNSYNQMVLNVEAKEKSVRAAESSCQAIEKKQLAGMATMSDVGEAQSQLSQERNQLASYQQRAGQLRFQLLSMLGMEDDGTVSIGAIPGPDLAAIGAVDFESDSQAAVNNNDSVKNVRHSRAGTTAEVARKAVEEQEAVGNAQKDIYAAYQGLQAARLEYQAALDGFESAQAEYQSLQRKGQAGMLSQTQYLQGEADYWNALSAKGTASMNLLQAYESYQWEVKGTSQARQ